jgi:hypothetical protein
MTVEVSDVSALDPGGKASDAIAGGVFTSSADNAYFSYLDAIPNTNPLWYEVVASGRHDWVAANTLVDTMNALSDPRRPLYFDQNLGAGVYVGGIYGDNNTYKLYTHITPTILTPTYHGILMTYSEIEFYLAEAAARHFIAGDPATFYNNGITASIVDDWGGDAGDAANYILTVPYPAGAADDVQWDAIALQSWIASYDRGLLGWTTWRRLDAPTLNTPAITGNPVPLRYTYPIIEQTLNGTNYAIAAGAIGGDTQQSRIFWDTH